VQTEIDGKPLPELVEIGGVTGTTWNGFIELEFTVAFPM
jgi:hypothetical protein